jgi:pentatricopeptide repeat protein
MKKNFLLTIFLLVAFISFAQPEKMKVAFDGYLQQYHEVRQLSGVVMVGMQGHVMYKNALGWSDPKANKKLEGQELFGIGSTTKLFTAILVMQLVEKGVLQLNDPLTKWIPEIKLDNAKKITIKHLLQHTAGLGNYMNHPMFGRLMGFGKIQSIDNLLPLIEEMPVSKQEPGTAYRYSNSGYILLGKVLENATKLSYPVLLQQSILTPLQLKESFPLLASHHNSLAQPYRYVDAKHFIHYPNADTIKCFPDGGLVMSADNLFRFGNALINHQLVKPATLEQMITDTVKMDKNSWYGLGIISELVGGKMWIGHDGFSRGYSVDLKISPAEKGILISMFNNNGVSSVQINKSIIEMIEQGKQPVAPKPYLWKLLHEQYKSASTITLTDMNDILKEKGYTPLTSPMQIIQLTGDLYEAGLLDISVELSQLNLRFFPNETITYNSLAEAYADMKNTVKAIEFFKQALKLNAKDEYATKRLKELGAL